VYFECLVIYSILFFPNINTRFLLITQFACRDTLHTVLLLTFGFWFDYLYFNEMMVEG